MCGINGAYFYKERELDHIIDQMNSSIQHRGPDSIGKFVISNMALGHSRLSIIDLSNSANQPFSDPLGYLTLVFNGEIYNYQSIKNELKDYDFKTSSDTEVILAAYQKWGKKCLSKFNGMFAFAIYDHQKKELFIARDRIGIKPLYYYQTDECFVFSSEIRALLNSEIVPRKINVSGISDYLRYQTVHAPKTLIKDVQMLMPGHFISISDEEIRMESYWELVDFEDFTIASSTLEQHHFQIKNRFYEAVERRTVADVPMGAFLSGGIDSAAIVGALSETSSKPVDTFTVVFDEREFSEAEAAEKMAKRFKTNHHEIHLRSADFLKEIPNALNSMDHPSGDGINTYVVSKATKEAGIKVALSGLGGDELFSGYPIFRQMESLNNKKWIVSYPKELRNLIGSTYELIKKDVASQKMRQVLQLDYFDLESSYPISRQLFLDHELSKLYKYPLVENEVGNIAKNTIGFKTSGFKFPYQSKLSILEMKTYMSNVLLRDADQMSMAHALEIRVPFLDHQLVQYMMNVSDNFKLTQKPKSLLVESLGGLLPKEVLSMPKKGFVFPWEVWLKNDLKEFCSEKLILLKARSFINEKEVELIWNRFLNGDKRVNYSKVWILVVLANWMEQNNIDE